MTFTGSGALGLQHVCMGDTSGHGGGTAHTHTQVNGTHVLTSGEDRAKGGTAGQLAGSFLEVAGPRWPQGGHLYSLTC